MRAWRFATLQIVARCAAIPAVKRAMRSDVDFKDWKFHEGARQLLTATVPAVPPIVWEYFYRLERKRLLLDESGQSSQSIIRWRTTFSREVESMEQCASSLVQLHDVCETVASDPAMSTAGAKELRELYMDEAKALALKIAGETELVESLVRYRVRGSDDVGSVSSTWALECLGKAGGEEAGLFAVELLTMFKTYCSEVRGWRVSDVSPSPGGGTLTIVGDNVYQLLKYEIGVHKVQRVPVTDADGKLQTSTATVTLAPEVDPVSVNVHEEDCKIDFVRGSGPGGQGMQSSSNACVLVHLPSGISVRCHQARSALANKTLALEQVAKTIWKERQAKQNQENESFFAKQLTTGERGEKMRTYNYPQNRVTDHRIGRDYSCSNFLLGGAELRSLHDELAAIEFASSMQTRLVKCIQEHL